MKPCKTCLSKTECLSCIDDYFLLFNQCRKCNINCRNSFDNCRCIICNKGFYFNNYQCLNCDPNCNTCNNKADYCTSCDSNKYLYQHLCLNCNDSCNINNKTEISQKDEAIQYYNQLLENVDLIFTSEFYDTTYIDNGEEEVMEINKMKIVLTSTTNQKNNYDENVTFIDLGECESLIKDYYNITDDKLYIKKVDLYQDYFRIPKIVYELYCKFNGSNLVKLNLTICQNSNISLLIPVEISESLDKLNTSSDYFNNICYIATSEKGTDISLKDRQKEFVEQNKTICQDG